MSESCVDMISEICMVKGIAGSVSLIVSKRLNLPFQNRDSSGMGIAKYLDYVASFDDLFGIWIFFVIPGWSKDAPEVTKIDNDSDIVFKLPSSDPPGGTTNLLASSKVPSLVSPLLSTTQSSIRSLE